MATVVGGLAILLSNTCGAAVLALVWRTHQHAVVGVCLDMLFKILRPLEGLAAEVALVWLERHMDADVRGNVVALDGGCATRSPLAGQVEVVGALAANMAFANVVIKCFGVLASLTATLPLTGQVVDGRSGSGLRCLNGRRGSCLGSLLRRSLHGLCDCLHTVHLKLEVEVEDGFLACLELGGCRDV